MGRWWKWIGPAATTGVMAGVLMTLLVDRSWGWDFAARCLLVSAAYASVGPMVTRSRRRAEERDAQHMRDIQKARRERR
jgi:hypothetical protein